ECAGFRLQPRRNNGGGRRSSDLFEAAGGVLVQQARDECLVGQSFRQRPLLDRLQVLARQSNIQPAIFAKRGLGVASVARVFALPPARGLPLTALERLEQFLFVRIKFHGRRTPHPITVSWPFGLE